MAFLTNHVIVTVNSYFLITIENEQNLKIFIFLPGRVG